MIYFRLLIIFWKTVPRATLARQSLTLFLCRETEQNRRNGKAATTISSLTQPDQESMEQQMKMRKKHDPNSLSQAASCSCNIPVQDAYQSVPVWFENDASASLQPNTRISAQAWVCQAMPCKSRSQERTLQEEVLSIALLKSGAACRTTSSAL